MIMVPNMKKIHLVIVEECTRMDIQMDRQTDRPTYIHVDRQTGWWTDGLDPFLYSPILLNIKQSGE